MKKNDLQKLLNIQNQLMDLAFEYPILRKIEKEMYSILQDYKIRKELKKEVKKLSTLM